jgi:hypothetical protein
MSVNLGDNGSARIAGQRWTSVDSFFSSGRYDCWLTSHDRCGGVKCQAGARHHVAMEDWDEVDRLIVEGQRIQAVQAIRAARGCGLPIALEILADRYTLLRKIRPNDFTQSHEDYWTGFYS